MVAFAELFPRVFVCLCALQALRAACEERDSRISDLEVQALRNTSTLKMLSSALEVSRDECGCGRWEMRGVCAACSPCSPSCERRLELPPVVNGPAGLGTWSSLAVELSTTGTDTFLRFTMNASQVAYKMLEAQQAALPQPNAASSLPDDSRLADDGDDSDRKEASTERQSVPEQDMEDVRI